MPDDDVVLLQRYATEGAEDAFREVVQRRFGLVYAVALRQVGNDAHLARDVAQRVFLELARQAGALSRRNVVSGWLYRTARFTAIDVIRAERRRQRREEEARLMHESYAPVSDAEWQSLRPVLDEALSELTERDRDAIVLRVFEDRSFAEIGRALQLTESAARMRFERAVEKLRRLLRRRGVTSTTAGLGLALANQVGAAVPAGLPMIVAGEALAGVKLAGVAASAGGLIFMSTTSSKTAGAVAVAVAAIATGVGSYHAREAAHAESAVIAISRDVAALRERNAAMASQLNVLTARSGDAPPTRRAAAKASGPATANVVDPVTADRIQSLNSAYEANRRLRHSNPEYQQLYEGVTRIQARLEHAALFKELELTREQIEEFEALLVERMWSETDRDAAAVAMDFKTSDPAVRELAERSDRVFSGKLAALLGQSGYERFRQVEKLSPVRDVVSGIAGETCFTDAPLTVAQGDELIRIMMRHHPKLGSWGWSSITADWSAILSEARSVLSSDQFDVLQGIAARMRVSAEDVRLLNEFRRQNP